MDDGDRGPEPTPVPLVGKRRRPTTAGTFLGAAMLGLAEALEGKPRREEPAVIEAAVGGDGDPIDLHLDDDPRLAVAFVRPWLRKP